ncbi:hypothetical protein Flav3CDRAFT_0921 [Flavobacteria bacterium MS024-3C]|nr:hypothetical protein Flav3CDRAFT_0921 [Flavobacteria bacterium MS024-3C]
MELKKIKHQTIVNEGDIENIWHIIEYLTEKVQKLQNEITDLKKRN